MLKTHLKLSNYIGECGFYSKNLTTDINKVTCKHCLKMRKSFAKTLTTKGEKYER